MILLWVVLNKKNMIGITGIEGQSGKDMCQGGKPDTGKLHSSYIGMNVCGSAYENGCTVNGVCAMAVDQVLCYWHYNTVVYTYSVVYSGTSL